MTSPENWRRAPFPKPKTETRSFSHARPTDRSRFSSERSRIDRDKAYLAGEWRDAKDGATFDVTNPARGDVIAKVADLSREECAEAIDAAYKAQKDWAQWTGKERAGVLRKWFDLMVEHAEDLGRILTAEQGKPQAEARAR